MAQSVLYPQAAVEIPREHEGAIEQIEDRGELQAYLMGDRLAGAYLLGNLDPLYAPFCRWYGVRGTSGELEAVALWYLGLSIPVVFIAAGALDAGRKRAFMEACAAVFPSRFHFHVIEEDMSMAREVFDVSTYQKLHRMGLKREHFKGGARDPRVERLGHRDTARIMELYAHYPDNFFEPYQLESGLYFGVRGEEGELLSIAGVHVISPEYDVAVIGNLITHPSARGSGLAGACTGRLLDELFEDVSLVALNVQVNNSPAIRLYTNFGFEPNNTFFEGRCGE